MKLMRVPALLMLLVVGFWTLQACGGGGSSGLTDVLLVVRSDGIAELSLAGGEHLVLTPPEDSQLIEPAVSPDGSTIAYVRQLTPIVVPGQNTELGMDIFLANRDGSNQRLLVEHSEPDEQDRTPVWFPDGQHILFNVQRFDNGQILTSIEELDITTGERTTVVEDGFRPALSPDASKILYVTQDENFLQRLWIANVDGTDPRLLAGPDDQLGSIVSPVVSPDGKTVAFSGSTLPAPNVKRAPTTKLLSATGIHAEDPASNRSAMFNGLPEDIWTIPAAGGELTKLAPLQLDFPSLAYSADGERLFVYAGLGLYVIDPKDGSTERLGDGIFHGQMAWVSAGD